MDISKHVYTLGSYLTESEYQFFYDLDLDSLNNTFKIIKSSESLNVLNDDDVLYVLVEIPDEKEKHAKIIEVKDVRMLHLTLYDIVASFSQVYAQDKPGYISIYNITPLLDKTINDGTYDEVYNHYLELIEENKQINFDKSSKMVSVDELFKNEKEDDKVNHPSHYNYGDIEVIDYIKQVTNGYANHPYEAYCIGNVLKYISRAPFKNGKEDLEKAQWYLNAALETYKDE